jgi:hypothetical protein
MLPFFGVNIFPSVDVGHDVLLSGENFANKESSIIRARYASLGDRHNRNGVCQAADAISVIYG